MDAASKHTAEGRNTLGLHATGVELEYGEILIQSSALSALAYYEILK